MAPVEAPLKCLAVNVSFDRTGQIDSVELEAFLNEIAGRSQWLSTTKWLFTAPPAKAGTWATVPVVLPEAVAAMTVSADASNDPPRVLHEHSASIAETLNWRALNGQCNGRFPWERNYV